MVGEEEEERFPLLPSHKTWDIRFSPQERCGLGRRGSSAMTSDSAEMQAGQIYRFDHTLLVPTYLGT